MKSLRFPRSSRLLSPKEFRRVFDHGRSCSDDWFVLYAIPNPETEGRPRLGLVISRRFGPAVSRNRWRRRIRETFRSIAAELPSGHDLVVLPKGKQETPDAPTAESSIRSLARRAAERYRTRGPR